MDESNVARSRVTQAVNRGAPGLVIINVDGLDRCIEGPRPRGPNENRGDLALCNDAQTSIIEAHLHDEQAVTQRGLHDSSKPGGALVGGDQQQVEIVFAQELRQSDQHVVLGRRVRSLVVGDHHSQDAGLSRTQGSGTRMGLIPQLFHCNLDTLFRLGGDGSASTHDIRDRGLRDSR